MNKQNQLCDVLAVSIENSTVRLLDTDKARDDAEAIVDMAVMRRGVEMEFYVAVPSSSYRDGERWEGQRAPLPPATPQDPDYYRIGNMVYPRGPRGLGS